MSPKSIISTNFNRSLLTLELKTKTCVMAQLVVTRSKFNPNQIEIQSQKFDTPQIVDGFLIGSRRLYYTW